MNDAINQYILLVMEEVMSLIIADVAKNTSAEGRNSSIPVVEEDGMSQLVERNSEDNEEGRRHDETVAIHRQVMVNAMKEEMGGYANTVIWKVPVRGSQQARSDKDGN